MWCTQCTKVKKHTKMEESLKQEILDNDDKQEKKCVRTVTDREGGDVGQ